jgi:hypothetical protein
MLPCRNLDRDRGRREVWVVGFGSVVGFSSRLDFDILIRKGEPVIVSGNDPHLHSSYRTYLRKLGPLSLPEERL